VESTHWDLKTLQRLFGSCIVHRRPWCPANRVNPKMCVRSAGEVAIHFPGFKGLDMPIVWVFPKIKICLECGRAEFDIPESELRALKTGEIEAA